MRKTVLLVTYREHALQDGQAQGLRRQLDGLGYDVATAALIPSGNSMMDLRIEALPPAKRSWLSQLIPSWAK